MGEYMLHFQETKSNVTEQSLNLYKYPINTSKKLYKANAVAIGHKLGFTK